MGWLGEPWHKLSRHTSSRRASLTSMASARVPAVRPCHASSARLPRSMPVLQSSPSMQLVPSTMPPRQAMLGAELCPLLPFARQFYGTPSSYVWVDGQSVTHHVAEGEGGEQSDPLMPALYALAQQPVLEEVQSQLRDGEAILAYLDDTYIVSSPERVCELYEAYRRALWVHARIALNRSKKNPCLERRRGGASRNLRTAAGPRHRDLGRGLGVTARRTGAHSSWHALRQQRLHPAAI